MSGHREGGCVFMRGFGSRVEKIDRRREGDLEGSYHRRRGLGKLALIKQNRQDYANRLCLTRVLGHCRIPSRYLLLLHKVNEILRYYTRKAM